MCGIAGIVGTEANIKSLVGRMINALAHRGPDSSGLWECDYACLAHSRLAILDLTLEGHQPMISHCGRYVIVFNGEIYNHSDLRKRLNDIIWRGTSDTETILECISKWSLETTLREIAGMFSFALLDTINKKLFLVRDRFGEKPLYYTFLKNSGLSGLAFSSEIKSLESISGLQALNIDIVSLGLFFQLSYIPCPRTIYEGVFKLEPGTYLEYSLIDNDVKRKSYWSTSDKFLDGVKNHFSFNPHELKNKLNNLLKLVISEQMCADVPVGAFLSGGIDSTLIVAIMKNISNGGINTYTIGYDEQKYSESKYSKSIANYLKTNHNELIVSPKMAFEAILSMASVYDEPFADPSQVPTYLVSKFASNHVRVALTGDGGDELFGGYNRYALTRKYWRKIALLSPLVRKGIASLMINTPESFFDKYLSFLPFTSIGFKAHKAARVLTSKNEQDVFFRLISNWPFNHTLVKGYQFDSSNINYFLENYDLAPQEKMMLIDTMTYLPDDILVKVDRAAMSCSLETRAPFIDHRIAEFAWRLPMEAKFYSGNTKWILRSLVSDYIPRKLFDRPKMGFGFPLDLWLRQDLREWADDLLSHYRLRESPFLNYSQVITLWDKHKKGEQNNAIQLWPVLMFQSWFLKRKEI